MCQIGLGRRKTIAFAHVSGFCSVPCSRLDIESVLGVAIVNVAASAQLSSVIKQRVGQNLIAPYADEPVEIHSNVLHRHVGRA
jgi:hypothetical protein